MISFSKMNGAGNDFVVLDNRDESLQLSGEEIARLCHRQFGIGADGLLMVEPARNGADFRMRYYNSDGGEAEMCGNGARCFARFVDHLEGNTHGPISFETMAGVISATFSDNGIVCINLSDPTDMALGETLTVNDDALTVHSINTGVPHAVVAVDDLSTIDINNLGSAIRRHDRFAPSGTNVNFMEVRGSSDIAVRTFERGVEGETLACGTGMVANAIVHHELTGEPSPISVTVHSGDTLQVSFEKSGDSYTRVTLTGPAEFVFEGEIQNPA
jgi:diaminopimelate epimerase